MCYSNIDALKKFIKPENKEKLNEMLLVAHAIVTAINVGKVVITKNLASINVTGIMSVVRYGVSVVSAMRKKNNEYAKLMCHQNRLMNCGHNWTAACSKTKRLSFKQ